MEELLQLLLSTGEQELPFAFVGPREITSEGLVFARLFEQNLLNDFSVVPQNGELLLPSPRLLLFVLFEGNDSLLLLRREFLLPLSVRLFGRGRELEPVLQLLEVPLRGKGVFVQGPWKKFLMVFDRLLTFNRKHLRVPLGSLDLPPLRAELLVQIEQSRVVLQDRLQFSPHFLFLLKELMHQHLLYSRSFLRIGMQHPGNQLGSHGTQVWSRGVLAQLNDFL